MTSLKTSIKTITYLSDTGCLEIQGASLLSSGTDSQLEYLFLKPAAEVKTDLQRRLASGERYVTTESCDNFSEVDGCMGHDC
ncbi:hypothetical protein LAW41_23275 [Escherichia coli]|nr:hypothetical protein [Escherichia coli]